jgi:hypothetical protein
MAGITLEQAQTELDLWLAADAKLATGQSYSIAGRSISRADALKYIDFWDKKVKELSASGDGIGISVIGVTPIV